MGGLENPPKHAYVIFEWSLRDKCKNSILRNLTRRQKIKKSLIMISPNELNLKTFISSLGAPDIYSIKYIYHTIHTVREWIYNSHKLPITFDSSLSIYSINAYKKCLKKLIWTKKKNHVPQGGIEPAPSLVRSGLARIKWKMSSALPTELLGHLYNCAQI